MPRTGLTAEEMTCRAVEAAEARMRLHGHERVRLADIARDLGVSHVALYRHFPDRAALLDAVSERWLDATDAELESVARGGGSARDGSARARIEAWFVALHRLKRDKVRRDPTLYAAFDAASESRKPFVVRHMASVLGTLTGLVREAMGEGSLPEGDPEAFARLLLELTLGYHHPRLVAERRDEDREADLRRVLAFLIDRP